MIYYLYMSGYEGIQVIVGMLVILGSGMASWVGVKVALAEMKQRQDSHDKDIEEIREQHASDIREIREQHTSVVRELIRRIERLENRYFDAYHKSSD